MLKIVNPHVDWIVKHELMLEPTIPAYIPETYAQYGEDLFLQQYLDAFFLRKGVQRNMTYLEIGANHPVCTSSTWLLRNYYNIRGILVEPIPELASQLRTYREGDEIVEAAVIPKSNTTEITLHVGTMNEVSSALDDFTNKWCKSKEIKVDVININSLLMQLSNTPDHILLFIDVEGLDFEILEEIDYEKYRPLIIQIEPSDWYIENNSNKIMNFMNEKEYKLICKNHINMIFIDKREDD